MLHQDGKTKKVPTKWQNQKEKKMWKKIKFISKVLYTITNRKNKHHNIQRGCEKNIFKPSEKIRR